MIPADALQTTKPFFLWCIGQGFDVLLMIKNNQHTLRCQVGYQFKGKGHIPVTATAHGKKHGRDTAWEMPALAEGKAVGSSRAHQRELVSLQLDRGNDHRHHDLQRPAEQTSPRFSDHPAA
jgi:hypothetical protein